MRPIVMVLLALPLLTWGAVAGEVYGTITDGSKPIAAGVKVEIGASDKVYTAQTDKFGSYRIFVKEKGKCTLTVHFKEHTPTVELFSYAKSTRYDWILETKEGKLSLRRK